MERSNRPMPGRKRRPRGSVPAANMCGKGWEGHAYALDHSSSHTLMVWGLLRVKYVRIRKCQKMSENFRWCQQISVPSPQFPPLSLNTPPHTRPSPFETNRLASQLSAPSWNNLSTLSRWLTHTQTTFHIAPHISIRIHTNTHISDTIMPTTGVGFTSSAPQTYAWVPAGVLSRIFLCSVFWCSRQTRLAHIIYLLRQKMNESLV